MHKKGFKTNDEQFLKTVVINITTGQHGTSNGVDHNTILVDDQLKVFYCFEPKFVCTNWKRVLLVLGGHYKGINIDKISQYTAKRFYLQGELLKVWIKNKEHVPYKRVLNFCLYAVRFRTFCPLLEINSLLCQLFKGQNYRETSNDSF